MKLSQTEKDIVDREYTKLTGIVNYLAENTQSQDKNVHDFIIKAAIEIYKKM